MEDLPRSGRPSTSSTGVDIVEVKVMVIENHHLSLREIAAELSVFHESICTILNDCLVMKRVAARLDPKDHLTRLSLWTNFWPKTHRISSNNHRIDLFIWENDTAQARNKIVRKILSQNNLHNKNVWYTWRKSFEKEKGWYR